MFLFIFSLLLSCLLIKYLNKYKECNIHSTIYCKQVLPAEHGVFKGCRSPHLSTKSLCSCSTDIVFPNYKARSLSDSPVLPPLSQGFLSSEKVFIFVKWVILRNWSRKLLELNQFIPEPLYSSSNECWIIKLNCLNNLYHEMIYLTSAYVNHCYQIYAEKPHHKKGTQLKIIMFL